jgi:hypothetical protein
MSVSRDDDRPTSPDVGGGALGRTSRSWRDSTAIRAAPARLLPTSKFISPAGAAASEQLQQHRVHRPAPAFMLRRASRRRRRLPCSSRIGRLSGRRELVRQSDAAGGRACRALQGSRHHARDAGCEIGAGLAADSVTGSRVAVGTAGHGSGACSCMPCVAATRRARRCCTRR